jgi:U3 small nucleolar RNA-associated protein 12
MSRPTLHPLIVARGHSNPSIYVMNIIRSIPLSELEGSLLILPFSQITSLLLILRDWTLKGCYLELLSRVLFFILRIHQKQITTNRVLKSTLEQIRTTLKAHVDGHKVCYLFLFSLMYGFIELFLHLEFARLQSCRYATFTS